MNQGKRLGGKNAASWHLSVMVRSAETNDLFFIISQNRGKESVKVITNNDPCLAQWEESY